MEFLIEILLEFLVEGIVQLLVEAGVRGIANVLQLEKPRNPWLAGFGYCLIACVISGLSLYVHPTHFIKNPELRMANLLFTPIVIGWLMGLRGKMLVKRGKVAIRIDTFYFGFLFAFVFALIRFVGAQ